MVKGFVNRLSHDCRRWPILWAWWFLELSSPNNLLHPLKFVLTQRLINDDDDDDQLFIELKRLFTEDFTLTTSTGTVELRFLKRRCLWSDNIATAEVTVSSSYNVIHALDRNPPITSDFCDTPITSSHGGTISSTKYIVTILTIAWWRPAVRGGTMRYIYFFFAINIYMWQSWDKRLTKPFIHLS